MSTKGLLFLKIDTIIILTETLESRLRAMEKQWYVYILQCTDGTLYTGITDNVQRRIAVHNSGKGAKYTRGRRPVVLLYEETCTDHSNALKREIEIKRLSKLDKLKLCNQAKVKDGNG